MTLLQKRRSDRRRRTGGESRWDDSLDQDCAQVASQMVTIFVVNGSSCLFLISPQAGWDAKKQINRKKRGNEIRKRELHELPNTKISKYIHTSVPVHLTVYSPTVEKIITAHVALISSDCKCETRTQKCHYSIVTPHQYNKKCWLLCCKH